MDITGSGMPPTRAPQFQFAAPQARPLPPTSMPGGQAPPGAAALDQQTIMRLLQMLKPMMGQQGGNYQSLPPNQYLPPGGTLPASAGLQGSGGAPAVEPMGMNVGTMPGGVPWMPPFGSIGGGGMGGMGFGL